MYHPINKPNLPSVLQIKNIVRWNGNFFHSLPCIGWQQRNFPVKILACGVIHGTGELPGLVHSLPPERPHLIFISLERGVFPTF